MNWGTLVSALQSSRHTIHHVAGESEGHELWRRQQLALIERNPKINVHKLRRLK